MRDKLLQAITAIVFLAIMLMGLSVLAQPFDVEQRHRSEYTVDFCQELGQFTVDAHNARQSGDTISEVSRWHAYNVGGMMNRECRASSSNNWTVDTELCRWSLAQTQAAHYLLNQIWNNTILIPVASYNQHLIDQQRERLQNDMVEWCHDVRNGRR